MNRASFLRTLLLVPFVAKAVLRAPARPLPVPSPAPDFARALQAAADQIFKATQRNPQSNWVIVGSEYAKALMPPSGGNLQNRGGREGIAYMGDFSGFKVYHDPYLPSNEFLVGYKGVEYVEFPDRAAHPEWLALST